jgi:hypothetical protein
MARPISYTGTLVTLTCWCGITHAVPGALREEQMREFNAGRKPQGIYCPLGHTHVPVGEPESERLRRQLEVQRQRAGRLASELEQTEASLRAQKAATTRAKKRHAAGVCPVCKRTFQQVQRHMASQHPDYKPE